MSQPDVPHGIQPDGAMPSGKTIGVAVMQFSRCSDGAVMQFSRCTMAVPLSSTGMQFQTWQVIALSSPHI